MQIRTRVGWCNSPDTGTTETRSYWIWTVWVRNSGVSENRWLCACRGPLLSQVLAFRSIFPPKYFTTSPDYAGDIKCLVLPTNIPHLELPFPFGLLGKVISSVLSLKLPPVLLCMWLGLNESNKTPIKLGWNESLLHSLAVWLTHMSFHPPRVLQDWCPPCSYLLYFFRGGANDWHFDFHKSLSILFL